ncbi:MAG: transketolase [Ignavibacteria bacterium]|nr:transketolase [Ignavibacteria bacterium]
MRNTFINTLNGKVDENTMLLIGDLGFSIVEKFAENHPGQLLNCGVAEQNMTGIAAGFAMEGFKVFTYSIANFNTLRCLEQIRNDICYHNLDVTVVSVGGGFVYGSAGYSHHAVQDVAILSSLPHMTMLLPGDPDEMTYCTNYALNNKGPKLLRVGKNGEKNVPKPAPISNIYKVIDSQAPIAILSTGGMLNTGFEVAGKLKEQNVDVDLLSSPVIEIEQPELYIDILKDYKTIFIIEEHIRLHGCGSIFKSFLEYYPPKIYTFGIERNDCHNVGKQGYLLKLAGLDADSLSEKIMRLIG